MSHAWPKVHEETYRGHLIEIIVDETPLDPREDAAGCCLGTMVTWHRRYTLGDEQPSLSPDAWIEDLAEQATGMNYEDADPGEAWADVQEHYIILPVALLDHSGITMYVGRGAHMCDPGGWDSGQVGWIYVSLEDVRKEYGDVSDESRARARAALEAEVQVYDWYLRGDVYGYVVKDPDTGEVADSCWGYFGYEGDGEGSSWNYMIDEARSVIDHRIKRARARHADRLKGQIRNRVPLGYREPTSAAAAG